MAKQEVLVCDHCPDDLEVVKRLAVERVRVQFLQSRMSPITIDLCEGHLNGISLNDLLPSGASPAKQNGKRRIKGLPSMITLWPDANGYVMGKQVDEAVGKGKGWTQLREQKGEVRHTATGPQGGYLYHVSDIAEWLKQYGVEVSVQVSNPSDESVST